ncbi:nitroreductase family protein [Sporosarcina sp. Sa2YVA2]|uniref:Nitroreductase family protein n=1 Tax=Sporosarcina quadrami TaxID=2762234 RepID=A0ABR8UAW6_9BACL|nr:nitroreductase family protein [Sporosarcina quadrami]MBD7985165.1 nitroreductase family protein [Sporosarcina quadrami]
MTKTFLDSVQSRRSIYAISSEQVISDERIEEIVSHAVKHTPSAFNSQTGRVVVLLGEQSDRLWKITEDTLRKIVPAENFHSTEERMATFGGGYGTILFFEDMAIVESMMEQFVEYKDNFPVWSLQSAGMLQFVIWTALEDEGFGASLQHYNPLIDEDVKKEWELPASWKLLAQMPFGKPLMEAGEKEFMPVEDRMKVIK